MHDADAKFHKPVLDLLSAGMKEQRKTESTSSHYRLHQVTTKNSDWVGGKRQRFPTNHRSKTEVQPPTRQWVQS